MLRAYLDESGQESNELVVIAGFVGNRDSWSRLLTPWKKALGNRKALHMSDLRWKEGKNNVRDLLKRLAPIPVDCGLSPICGGIRVKDYEDLLPIDNPILHKIHSGYISSLFPLLVHLLASLPDDERVELVFEQQDRYWWLTDFVLHIVSLNPHPRFRTRDGKPKLAKWSYVPKGSTTLTEPADFFAYTLLQYYRDPDSLRSRWCLPLVQSVDSVKTVGRIMTRDQARSEVLAMLDMLAANQQMAKEFAEVNRHISEMVKSAKKN